MTASDWISLSGVAVPVIVALFAGIRWDTRNAIAEAVRLVTSETVGAERLAEATFADKTQVARLEERIRELSENVSGMREDWRAWRRANGGE